MQLFFVRIFFPFFLKKMHIFFVRIIIYPSCYLPSYLSGYPSSYPSGHPYSYLSGLCYPYSYPSSTFQSDSLPSFIKVSNGGLNCEFIQIIRTQGVRSKWTPSWDSNLWMSQWFFFLSHVFMGSQNQTNGKYVVHQGSRVVLSKFVSNQMGYQTIFVLRF